MRKLTMSCVLRASGRKFDVEEFLRKTKLKTIVCWKRREPRHRTKPAGENRETSGFNCDVSTKDFDDLPGQIKDAIKFLNKWQRTLRKLTDLSTGASVRLDFGIERRDVIFQFDILPSALLRAAGELGIDIEISQYPKANRTRTKRSR
ncbi:MAG: hypothetical protein HY301_11925 [Verrucomicrobia bacterium]|nr:hypothetical protein [Verrucomicrobiota bacterium]